MTTRTTVQTSFIAERVEALIESYPLATTDYDTAGCLKDEATERIVHFVLGRLTLDQRNELAGDVWLASADRRAVPPSATVRHAAAGRRRPKSLQPLARYRVSRNA